MTAERLVNPWKLPPQKTYVFYNASIIDPVEGIVLPNKMVRISNGLIDSVTDTTDESIYEHIKSTSSLNIPIFVNLEAKYLCPGLIDNHVHLSAVPGEKDLRDLWELDPSINQMRQPYVCREMLQRGFTSVRDCGGASLALKEAINEGVIQGPRLFIAGHALTQTGGHADTRGAHNHTECCGGTVMSLGRLCDGVPECIKAAREELRTGADFIKIMGGGGVSSPTDALTNLQFSPEEIQAITGVARNANTYVTAHAYTPKAIRMAIENGATGIEHGNLIDEETARYMAEKDIFLTPTLITYASMASPKFPGFLPEESRAKNEQILKAGLRSIQIAAEAGVTICYGSDLLGPLGVEQSKEFSLRAQVLSAKDILRSATINPARRFGLEGWMGQIKEGFVADLLVLNENPLEDIGVLERVDECLLVVFKEGRAYHSRWSKLEQDVIQAVGLIETLWSKTNSITLNAEPHIFEMVVMWMYSGLIQGPDYETVPTFSKRFKRYMKFRGFTDRNKGLLWLLAGYLQVRKIQETIEDIYQDQCQNARHYKSPSENQIVEYFPGKMRHICWISGMPLKGISELSLAFMACGNESSLVEHYSAAAVLNKIPSHADRFEAASVTFSSVISS